MGRCHAYSRKGNRCRNNCSNGLTTCYIHSDECIICFNRLGNRAVLNKLSCGHLFHEECILRWIDTDGRCPVCRYACRKPFVTVHDLTNTSIPDRQIPTILRRLHDAGELHTDRVAVTTDADTIFIIDISNGNLIISEPIYIS